MTDETDKIDPEAFAEGMEAAHCGLLMKHGPRGSRTWQSWRAGYIQALADRGDYQPKLNEGE
jgi:hypothetical protein